MTHRLRLAILLGALLGACSQAPLVPSGNSSWAWRIGVSPEREAPTAARILKKRLRAAGVKDPKVRASPPPLKHSDAPRIPKERPRAADVEDLEVRASPPPTKPSDYPGSLVASEVRVEVSGVAEEAKPIVLLLITTSGGAGGGVTRESNPEAEERVRAFLAGREPIPAKLTILDTPPR